IDTGGTVALQVALNTASDSMLLLAPPTGAVTPVVTGQPDIQPFARPTFGPGGLLFFLAKNPTLPADRNGRSPVGLYRFHIGETGLVGVAVPGQPVPGWQGARLLIVTQRPEATASDVIFGILFGGPESMPVPTAALFRVPLLGTLADGTLAAPEGVEETDTGEIAMLRDLSFKQDGTLVFYGLLPGAGPLLAHTTVPVYSAGLVR